MFEKGKVYKTTSGRPAKVIWVAPPTSELSGYMCVLHYAFTKQECVFLHFSRDGKYFENETVDDLTEELYND